MAVGEVDGELALIRLQKETGEWLPSAILRLEWSGQSIIRIADYGHCPWVLSAAASVVIAAAFPN
jgi:RNA polymerase sigma-70 factor (ECF subfamily)